MVAKAATTCTPPVSGSAVRLISDAAVAAAATDRQAPRQHAERWTTLQPFCTLRVTYKLSILTSAPTHSQPPARPIMVTIVPSRDSTLLIQRWTIVFRKGKIIPVAEEPTSKTGNAQERSIAAEHPGPSKGHPEIERRIMFPHRSGHHRRTAATRWKSPTSRIWYSP